MEKDEIKDLVNGLSMGMNAIDTLIDKIENKQLRDVVLHLRKDYDDLFEKLQRHYPHIEDEIKSNFMAESMLKMKTIMTNDQKIVKMLIEGCNQAIITTTEVFNHESMMEPDLKSCFHDFEEISNRYIEQLKTYL